MILTKEYAVVILEMENVCYSEGIGPDSSSLIHAICDEYPELLKDERFEHLSSIKDYKLERQAGRV